MNVTVAVYQERVGAELRWTTLGLGDHTQRERGPHAGKLQQKVANALREVVAKLNPRALSAFEFVRGTRLETVHVEVALRHEGRRRKVSMICPLVVEPRRATPDTRLVIAYHPARQGRWFPVHDDMTLVEQATAFFADDWSELDDNDLDELRLKGRGVLKSFSFATSPKSLLDELTERPRGVWDDLRNDGPRRDEKRHELLPQLGHDVTWKVIDGSITPTPPRSPWREQLRLLLCQATPQPCLVVGPSGSGRTSLIERAVADLLDHDGYASHRNADRVRHVWQVSGKRVIAGMSHLGDWQQRCLDLVAEARARRCLLLLTDAHHFGRIGRSRDSEMNLAEFFAGPLARREVTMLGECTEDEVRRLEEDAPAFAALFTRVLVREASSTDTLRMLLHEVRRLESQHPRLRVHPGALREILEVGAALVPTRAWPGKAVDLLRQAVRDALTAHAEADAFVGAWQVDVTLSARTGLPVALLSPSESLDPATVRTELAAQVMGQPEAVDAAVDVVVRIRAGLVDPKRPCAVYLFAGPTGTGKTELAKALARYLYGSTDRLLRLDMGEFNTPDAAARLVGDRWTPDGVLTRALLAQPFCVVLLDEIEKAHPQVHNLLLQVFDEARLTDASGAVASFAQSVIVMTSNLGARAELTAGFGAAQVTSSAEHLKAVRDFFPPELFNRIDRVVAFRSLTPAVARAVVARELTRLTRRRGLLERNAFVTADEAVLDHVVAEAFRAADGARSLKRWLEDRVGSLLTDLLVRSPGNELRFVTLRLRDGGLGLDVVTLREADPMAANFPLEACLTDPLPRLQGRLSEARRALAALAASPRLADLSERIRALVARHRAGAHDGDDALYTLESLRGEVTALDEHLESLERAASRDEDWELRAMEIEGDERIVEAGSYKALRHNSFDRRALAARAAPTRADVLDALAEVAILQRAVAEADAPLRHEVTLTLTRATPAELLREGPSAPDGGLFEQLTLAYASARGVVEEAVVLTDAGARIECRGGEGLYDAVYLGVVCAVTLRISGLCVWDFFRHEQGTHVWRTLAGVPEIVRVTAAQSTHTPAEISAASGPELPVIRSIRFDPPRQSGGAAPLEIEDYGMAIARTSSARKLSDPLLDLWRIRAAREDASAH
jgi:ATP-dependent Clp protease ATP-binding subunit ClpA/ATP-dependent Clp protease ATP-binding subunit ClpC